MITGDIDCGPLGFAHKVVLVCVTAQSIRLGGELEMHSFFVQWANAYRSLAQTTTNEPPQRNK
jgi:hypothetical protein